MESKTDAKDDQIEMYDLSEKHIVKDVLIRMPYNIWGVETSLMKNDILKGDLIKKAKTIKGDVERGVGAETHEVLNKKTEEMENKAVYTNDRAREAQTNTRLLNNNAFIEFNGAADKLDKKVKEQALELSYLKRAFSAAKAITRMGD